MHGANFVNGVVAQCFPLRYGKLNLTSGVYTGANLVHCVADGNIILTFPASATPVTVACVEGNEFSVSTATSVEVSTGTFHIA
jgi:hypothetical protein